MMLSGAAALGGCTLLAGPPASLREIGGRDLVLTARERKTALCRDPLWVYDDFPFPVIRARRGEELTVTLKNALREHTSIHWHGIRLANAMDGVPYLTQLPVQPGESFTYRFTPPDAGTFFFHPHCNTVEQLGRGLIGALIVEDGAPQGDAVLILKDWRIGEDGAFLPFFTAKGANQAGTFGTLRTINGQASPTIAHKGRVRLINADSTRIAEIGIEGAKARVIAIDGNAVAPFALESWKFGPGMRLDLAIEAREARLVDYFAAEPVLLATLKGGGNAASEAPEAGSDFAGATEHTLELGAGVGATDIPNPPPILLPDGRQIDIADSLCLAQGAFWTLDGASWPARDHQRLPPPLLSLKRGEKLKLTIANTTSRSHPIHIHGHTMQVLSTSLLARPKHRADTVMVLPNERVTVGFVADNPGNWMVHCHIIEHQETGMMGWFRVS